MSGALLLARRNLTRNRVRFLASVGGVALAFSLILALDAIFAGVSEQLSAYIDRAGADVWVSQAGVRNLHMVNSSLPASVTQEVEAVDGVSAVTPILEATDTIGAGDERSVVYLVGLPPGAPMGGPWDVVEGAAQVDRGEIIVDRGFARRAGVGIGDRVDVLGHHARIVGVSVGTASLVNAVAFVALADFQAARNDTRIVSFVLVRIEPGASADAVSATIERTVEGVTAQSRAAFADQERRLVLDMSADVISIMDGIGFVVGLVVVALTVYVASLSRRREYGALKAIGAGNAFLYLVVLDQAILSVAIGFAAGIGVTAVLGRVVPLAGLDLELSITVASVTNAAILSAVIAGLAAVLPIRGIAGLEPAIVFRRGAIS
jgi:putative ABC transport system permease protein